MIEIVCQYGNSKNNSILAEMICISQLLSFLNFYEQISEIERDTFSSQMESPGHSTWTFFLLLELLISPKKEKPRTD